MGDRSRGAVAPPRSPEPRPLGGLADLADLVGGESDRSRRFLGGLVAGALVGAAVVGTVGGALVRRQDGRRSQARAGRPTVTPRSRRAVRGSRAG